MPKTSIADTARRQFYVVHGDEESNFSPEHDAISAALESNGFARISPAFLTGADELSHSYDEFRQSLGDLRADPSCPDMRFRGYQPFTMLAWANIVEPHPTVVSAGKEYSQYFQARSLNKLDGGVVRHFGPLSFAQRHNEWLADSIHRCFSVLPAEFRNDNHALWVGIHLIRTVARPDIPGVSSPNCVHCDGEPYTFVFLLERDGVSGGENFVTEADCAGSELEHVTSKDLRARFTLDEICEGYVVDDQRVAHHVSEIAVSGDNEFGSRTILIIDFTPQVPDIPR